MNLDAELARLDANIAHYRYTILCNFRSQSARTLRLLPDRVVKRDLTWDEANLLRYRLQQRHYLRNPKRSSWTCRLYWIELQS